MSPRALFTGPPVTTLPHSYQAKCIAGRADHSANYCFQRWVNGMSYATALVSVLIGGGFCRAFAAQALLVHGVIAGYCPPS